MLKRSPTKEKPASTPIHEAIRSKKLADLKKQLSKKSAKDYILQLDHSGLIPLALAIQENLFVFVEEILIYYGHNLVNINFSDVQKNTVLHKACSESVIDERILIALLRFPGIDVHLQNVDGNTPLHLFCEKFGRPSVIEHLNVFFTLGADVNAQNEFGESLLHKACLNNSVRLLLTKALLQRKANPNLANDMGETPLHYAVRMNREDLAMVLIRSGAQLDIRGGKKKQTPCELADAGNMAKLATRMHKVEDLFAWMKSVSSALYENYRVKFLEEEIFLDSLAYVTAPILEKMGIKEQALISAILNYAREAQKKPDELSSFAGTRLSRSATDTEIHSPRNNEPKRGELTPSATDDTAKKSGVFVVEECVKPGSRLPPHSRTSDMLCESSRSSSTSSDTPSNFRDNTRAERPRALSLPQQFGINAHEIEFLECAGIGTVAKVFRSLYCSKDIVATKVFKASDVTKKMLQKELNIICSLFHPNILLVYGMCKDLSPEKLAESTKTGLIDCVLVTEFCKRDSLYTVMSNSLIEITWPRFFRWSIQLLSALAFLHSSQPSMVHHNVKSLNVLVCKDWNLKLGDIGKAQFFFTSSTAKSIAIASSFQWFAPEVLEGIVVTEIVDESASEPTDPASSYIVDLDNAPFSPASDVYSAGIVMWELLRRTLGGAYERPWEGEHDLPPVTEPVNLRSKMLKLEKRFYRPYLLHDNAEFAGEKQCSCPPPLFDLYEKMTAKNPEERPTAASVVETLKVLLNEYTSVSETAMDWDERRRVAVGAKPIRSDRKTIRFPPTRSFIAKAPETIVTKSTDIVITKPTVEEWDDEPGTSHQHKVKGNKPRDGGETEPVDAHKQQRKHRRRDS